MPSPLPLAEAAVSTKPAFDSALTVWSSRTWTSSWPSTPASSDSLAISARQPFVMWM